MSCIEKKLFLSDNNVFVFCRSVFLSKYTPYSLYQESQNVRGAASMTPASISCLLLCIIAFMYARL